MRFVLFEVVKTNSSKVHIQDLGAALLTHKSRLQREKEACLARNPETVRGSTMKSAALQHAESNRTSLGSSLRKHKSALEHAKEAAAANRQNSKPKVFH